jgi:hypothetical protein
MAKFRHSRSPNWHRHEKREDLREISPTILTPNPALGTTKFSKNLFFSKYSLNFELNRPPNMNI